MSSNKSLYKIYYEEDEYQEELTQEEVAQYIDCENNCSTQTRFLQTTMNNKVLSAIDSKEFGDKYPCSIHKGCSIITFQNTGSQQVSAFHPKTIETFNAF